MANYAQLETRHADLATEFGREWATKLFGAEAIASLPVRASGKNKGAPKGFIIWRTATAAGYCQECCCPLDVGGFCDAWIGTGPLSPRGSVDGQWLGRRQALAASFSAGYFYEEGRAREAARQAACNAVVIGQ
jgi:hypothetical protein